MKRVWMCAALATLAVLPTACSDDGDGDGGGGGGSAAVAFTAANAVASAGMFALVIEPFTSASQAMLTVVEEAEAAAAAAKSTADVTDLGDLGLCASGTSTGTWDDRDGDRAVSAGDVLGVTLAACDGVAAATLSLTLGDVGYALTTATVALAVTVQETDGGVPVTTALTGLFRAEMNRVPDPPTFVSRLLVSDQADPTQRFVVTRNGATVLELACFNLYFTFDRQTGGFTLSEPVAVLRTAAGTMSVESWGLTALSFPDGVTPVAGQVRFLAFSVATPCAAVEVPADGIASNESSLLLTVGSGGVVTLTGQTDGGEPFTVGSNWSELD